MLELVALPEVVLVVILQAAMMVLVEDVSLMFENPDSEAAMLPFWAGFLLGIGIMLFAVIWQMVYLGFLKTAATDGNRPQPRVVTPGTVTEDAVLDARARGGIS